MKAKQDFIDRLLGRPWVETDGRRVTVTINLNVNPIERRGSGASHLVRIGFSANDAQGLGQSLEAAGTQAKWNPPKARKR
jgi:hypothetical protein